MELSLINNVVNITLTVDEDSGYSSRAYALRAEAAATTSETVRTEVQTSKTAIDLIQTDVTTKQGIASQAATDAASSAVSAALEADRAEAANPLNVEEFEFIESKNIFDPSLELNDVVIDITNGNIVTSLTRKVSGYQRITAGEWFISGLGLWETYDKTLWFYDENKVPISSVNILKGDTQSLLTAPLGSSFVAFTTYINSTNHHKGDDIMIEEYIEGQLFPSPYEAFFTSKYILKNYLRKDAKKLLEVEVSNNEITPNDFLVGDQNQRIKDALLFLGRQGGGTLILGVDTISVPNTSTWLISESLIIPSNTTVFLDSSRLKMADGVFDNLIRNEGIEVDPSDPNGLALNLNPNVNIKILGTGVGASFIEGASIPYNAPHPINGGDPVDWVGDWYGWRTFTILFANVNNYEISGISFSKTKCWAISQEHGCENMYLHNLDFVTNVKNGDGINFRKGCKNGLVENVTGDTYDDMVACTAIIGSDVYPNGNYIFPFQVGGWASSILGDVIENITIKNVIGNTLRHLVRCLASGGGELHSIKISNIEDTGGYSAKAVLICGTGYGDSAILGQLTQIYANKLISFSSDIVLKIEGPLKDCGFNYINQQDVTGLTYDINPDFGTENVTVTNVLT